MVPSRDIRPNSEIVGVFQGAKLITIEDQNTHDPKEVWRYLFRDPRTGDAFVILGRVALDEAFERVYAGEGGQDRCKGLNMRITRGKDESLSRSRTMGTYDIAVWEE